MALDERVLCSTITFRHLPLAEALDTISGLGFRGIDLGALPGVCDHVPYVLDDAAVAQVAETVIASGLFVRSVNADIGDLNVPVDAAAQAERDEHLDRLLDLCVAVCATALVLPNGAQSHDPIVDLESDIALVADRLTGISRRAGERGIELWVEAPHFFRLCCDLERSALLYDRLPAEVGAVCDVSHIVASGSTPRAFLDSFADRTRHVHLRDAEPGYIHHSIGRGTVDFADLLASLDEHGYRDGLALELETRDVENDERPAAALAAAQYITELNTSTTS